MKLLGLSFGRKMANTEILVKEALTGAEDLGVEVGMARVTGLTIEPCRGGGECDKNAICCIKDDMQVLYKKLKSADAIIVASPVYFGSVPAQLKAAIDRCQAFWVENFLLKKRCPAKKRKGIFISVGGHSNKRFFRNSKDIIEIFFMVMRVSLFKTLFVPGLECAGDVLKRRLTLKRAFEHGASLAGSARRRRGRTK